MLGFIRPEYNYSSLGSFSPFSFPFFRLTSASSPDALIKDIDTDKLVAATSVARPAYSPFQADPFFAHPSRLAPPTVDPAAPRVKPSEAEAEAGVAA